MTTATLMTECHDCGEPIKLRFATAQEAYDHGFDAVEDEYLIGTCYKRFHADGSRTHYTRKVTVIHKSDVEGA